MNISNVSKGTVYNVLTGKPIKSGLSGGVSFLGLFAGLIGSLSLSFLALPSFGWRGMLFITVLGFLGSIIDSILGFAFQRKYTGPTGDLQEIAAYHIQEPVQGFRLITNNMVNFLSLSLVPLLGYGICLVFF